MASLYVDGYRPWPDWVVRGNEEIARKFGAQIGTYRGHADRDPGHDMSGNLAADFWLYDNTKAKHDAVLAWFKTNARRIGATYIITRSRIWSVERASEGVRTYGGGDPHNDHIHISYGTNPTNQEEDDDDMPLSNDDIDRIWDRVTVENVWGVGDNPKVQADSALRLIGRDARDAKEGLADVQAQLAEILKRLPAPANLDDGEGIE